jgi:hypothetical protein
MRLPSTSHNPAKPGVTHFDVRIDAKDLTLPDNTASVRFIVYDRGSNTLGSVTIPIEGLK